jgi:hypothetical protein
LQELTVESSITASWFTDEHILRGIKEPFETAESDKRTRTACEESKKPVQFGSIEPNHRTLSPFP